MPLKNEQLTPHFWLSELIVTSHRGIDNTPTDEIIDNLRVTAAMGEKVRAICDDKPMYITSGYRSFALNRAVGGSTNSAHVRGMAIDFTIPAFGTPLDICKTIEIYIKDFSEVDQLIYEVNGNHEWVHLAWDPSPRRDANRIITGRNGIWTPGLG